jgi:hypothetical protein
MAGLGVLWNSIQTWLFPMLEEEPGELDEKPREFVTVCETCAPQSHMGAYRWVGNGYPPKLFGIASEAQSFYFPCTWP